MPGSPKWFLSLRFPHKTLYTPLLSPISVTCPANLILLYRVYINVWCVTCRTLDRQKAEVRSWPYRFPTDCFRIFVTYWCESKEPGKEGPLILVGTRNTPHTKQHQLMAFHGLIWDQDLIFWASTLPTRLNQNASINRRNVRSVSPAQIARNSQFTKTNSCRNCF
jgi:hypothetical protein